MKIDEIIEFKPVKAVLIHHGLIVEFEKETFIRDVVGQTEESYRSLFYMFDIVIQKVTDNSVQVKFVDKGKV